MNAGDEDWSAKRVYRRRLQYVRELGLDIPEVDIRALPLSTKYEYGLPTEVYAFRIGEGAWSVGTGHEIQGLHTAAMEESGNLRLPLVGFHLDKRMPLTYSVHTFTYMDRGHDT